MRWSDSIPLLTLLLVSCLAGIMFGPSSANAGGGVALIDSPGLWTLDKLGSQDITLDSPVGEKTIELGFELPADAKQGPETWYVMRLDYSIRVSSSSGIGAMYLSGLTNGYASAQIETWTEATKDGGLMTKWSTVDLLDGYREYSSEVGEVQGTFLNYMQTKGIRPGSNTLTFKVETAGDIGVENVTILKSSGIQLTDESPPRLKLSVQAPPGPVRIGDTIWVAYTLSNEGDYPAKEVVVRVQGDKGLELTESTEHALGSIDEGVTVDGLFTFRSLEKGSYTIPLDVYAKGGANQPYSRIVLTVVPPNRVRPAWTIIGLSVVLFAGVAGTALTVGRNRLGFRSSPRRRV